MKITRFEDLKVWQEARVLANGVLDISESGNFSKNPILKDQICRASLSVMANAAEGFLGQTDKQFIRFLYMALSSCTEVQSHLYLALDRKYISSSQFRGLFDRAVKISKMTINLIRYLEKSFPSRNTASSPKRR